MRSDLKIIDSTLVKQTSASTPTNIARSGPRRPLPRLVRFALTVRRDAFFSTCFNKTAMKEQSENRDEEEAAPPAPDKGGAVKDSIKKLKERFVPGVKYTLLMAAAFNLAMLVIGCINVHKCPVNKNIPLFLIAIGAIGLVSKFVSYIRERISRHVQVKYFESALYSVETIFFFLGTYWVYKEFQPSYDAKDINYCNKTAYLFAFIYLSVHYAILITMVLGVVCFLCCVICIVATEKTDKDVESASANTATVDSLTNKEEKSEVKSP